MSDPDYRVQARAVRAAARQRIRELSLQRGTGVPRWQAAASAPAAPAAAAPSPAAAAPRTPGQAPLRAPATSGAELPADQTQDIAAAAVPPVAAAAEAHEGPAADIEADAEADGHDLSVMTVSLAAATLAHRTAGGTTPPAPAAPAESDLACLPGVGPGLVWLLAQAGVPDCQTLLRTDAAVLATRLGIVGQLIEIGGLQALAARTVETPSVPRART